MMLFVKEGLVHPIDDKDEEMSRTLEVSVDD